jgi:hypothetical protein
MKIGPNKINQNKFWALYNQTEMKIGPNKINQNQFWALQSNKNENRQTWNFINFGLSYKTKMKIGPNEILSVLGFTIKQKWK